MIIWGSIPSVNAAADEVGEQWVRGRLLLLVIVLLVLRLIKLGC
jgi:hypothetical protein